MKVPRLFLISHESVKLLRQRSASMSHCPRGTRGPSLKEFFYE